MSSIRSALGFLPSDAAPPDRATRRLRIETYDGRTILGVLRVEKPHPHALLFMGFGNSPDESGVEAWHTFGFFDMEGGGLGILAEGGTIFGPVRLIQPEVAGHPWRRPKSFPPLRLAASNGQLMAQSRARRTKAK